MRYQRNSHSCAAAALQNALLVLGVRVGQGRLARLIGVTDDGADEHDLLDAIARLNLAIDIHEGSRANDARAWLLDRACHGPVLLCVSDWSHWVTVAGVCGDRLMLFDPDRTPANARENGCWPLAASTVLRRWRAARANRTEGGLFYGIAIFRS